MSNRFGEDVENEAWHGNENHQGANANCYVFKNVECLFYFIIFFNLRNDHINIHDGTEP